MNIRSPVSEIQAKLWKNSSSRNVKEYFKKFPHPDPGMN